MWITSTSFNVWVRYVVWNFKGTLWNSTQNILLIHWNIWLLYSIEILRALRFKSSYSFLKRPPDSFGTDILYCNSHRLHPKCTSPSPISLMHMANTYPSQPDIRKLGFFRYGHWHLMTIYDWTLITLSFASMFKQITEQCQRNYWYH